MTDSVILAQVDKSSDTLPQVNDSQHSKEVPTRTFKKMPGAKNTVGYGKKAA